MIEGLPVLVMEWACPLAALAGVRFSLSLRPNAGARSTATAHRVPLWAVPTGLCGDALTALYGTGGPVYRIYLARWLADETALRANIGVLIFCIALVRLVLFSSSGFYGQAGLLPLAAALLLSRSAKVLYQAAVPVIVEHEPTASLRA